MPPNYIGTTKVSDNIPDDSRKRLIYLSYRASRYHALHGLNCEAAPRYATCPSTSPTPNWRPPTACRAMAHQEGERAKRIEDPTRGPLETNAKRYGAQAEKLQ